MTKWARTISGKKTNNYSAAVGSKIQLRKNVCGEIKSISVFDAFAGSGMMYRHVWRDNARHYMGCDLKWYPDERLAYVANNLRILRAIDLQQFNVFDFDNYGSPWQQCCILADRRSVAPNEKIGVLLTDGSSLNLRMGGMPLALKEICGFHGKLSGASPLQSEITNIAINGLANRMGCSILKRWQAKGKTGAAVVYTALVFQGLPVNQRGTDRHEVDYDSQREGTSADRA